MSSDDLHAQVLAAMEEDDFEPTEISTDDDGVSVVGSGPTPTQESVAPIRFRRLMTAREYVLALCGPPSSRPDDVERGDTVHVSADGTDGGDARGSATHVSEAHDPATHTTVRVLWHLGDVLEREWLSRRLVRRLETPRHLSRHSVCHRMHTVALFRHRHHLLLR
ncbi:hypothetical protein Taro_028643 [Colocasia esculenta]|uniref:Uncharacterized protein n=1 Tax=Colocasia esculenta TaxID=4460 RepID=A0A843VSH9_COLES|nr:hypothetical protein [Colocasia esculenta]